MFALHETSTTFFSRKNLHCKGLLATLGVLMAVQHSPDHHCRISQQRITQCLLGCCSVSG